MRKKCIIVFIAITFAAPLGIFADGEVMFNYQGEVSVNGIPFTGVGYFKFAIVNNLGTVSLWSNDGTSFNGEEPVTAVAVVVNGGVFNVMLGDPDLGMEPINSVIFNHPNQIRLRIWFNDGEHGFQQLVPDRRIANPQLMGILTGREDFTIYVDGTLGDDENNGLTTETAKRTIQAAVDVLPSRLRCNVTIEIADGVYREEVNVYGIMVEGGSLIFVGDEGWTPGSAGEPGVRVTGCDEDTSGTGVRNYGFDVRKCNSVTVRGILFDYTKKWGMVLMDGYYVVENCKASYNRRGFDIQSNCTTYFTNCVAEYNGEEGFYLTLGSWGILTSCAGRNNGGSGVFLNTSSRANFEVSGDYSNNGSDGIHVVHKSVVFFNDPQYSGTIHNNIGYGLSLGFDSYSQGHGRNNFSGNSSGAVYTGNGSYTY